MLHVKKKDFWTIPNLLCYFRILLIPVFIWSYLRAQTPEDYFISAAIIALSGLTDFFDGYIARKFNQITDLGKILDPLADKLTQGALVFCLTTRYPGMWVVVALFIIKEGFMGIMGIIMLRHNGHKLDGAMWFGKVSTAVLYVTLTLLLLVFSMPMWLANAFITLCAVVMLFALVSYIPVFRAMWHQPPKKDKGSSS